VQTTGSLAQTSLAALLETMQAERATGTLSVKHGEESCNLYFLFGHLFHASGDLGQGEEAVVGALAWPDGEFNFDPRAKLPAEETIKSATQELLAEADRRAAGGEAPEPAPEYAAAEASEHEEPELVAVAAGHEQEEQPAPFPTNSRYVPTEEPTNGEKKVIDTPLTAGRPAASGAPTAQVFGNPDAPPIGELYPLPTGKAVYEGLKSAFVDFPKLLRTLDNDKLTGYVRLAGDSFSGVLLLHDGHVLEALFSDGGQITQQIDAFQSVRRRMEAGEGLLDVIELSGETVVALAQLLTARPLFTGLLGRFINFDALLEYLAEEKIDGSLVVAGGTETGVILLRKGVVHGAYTQSQRELANDAKDVTALAQERPSRIEVKSGAGSPPGIDVEGALRAII
jgi:hypothetical protein